MVDLGGLARIEGVVIWNRTDQGLGFRLAGKRIDFLDDEGNVLAGQNGEITLTGATTQFFDLPTIFGSQIEATRVRVWANDGNVLNFAELEVFGTML